MIKKKKRKTLNRKAEYRVVTGFCLYTFSSHGFCTYSNSSFQHTHKKWLNCMRKKNSLTTTTVSPWPSTQHICRTKYLCAYTNWKLEIVIFLGKIGFVFTINGFALSAPGCKPLYMFDMEYKCYCRQAFYIYGGGVDASEVSNGFKLDAIHVLIGKGLGFTHAKCARLTGAQQILLYVV